MSHRLLAATETTNRSPLTTDMPRIIDISPSITPSLAVWPGDHSFRREEYLRLADGDPVNLSAIHTTVHLGAHADAPNHYLADGAGIEAMPLSAYYGPCQVVEVSAPAGKRILPAHLPDEGRLRAPRLLLKTLSFPDPQCFTRTFNSLSPELVEHCRAQGVVLIGIDTPSVDPFDDKDLSSHHALARSGMANLEGLALAHVPPGLYTMIALPLRLCGADASPVRAALVDETGGGKASDDLATS